MILTSTLLAIMVIAQAPRTVAYEEFVKVPVDQRDAVYAALTPENKAELSRGRFQRWLDDNRATLSTSQASAVQEAIASVTPELFRAPQDPTSIQRQLTTGNKLYCALGAELAYAFAKDQTPAPPVARSWTQVFQQWTHWIVECVVK
jgi:hypothetical protein